MPRGARITLGNACYHIITRGNQKQRVFLESKDYTRYLEILRKCKTRYKFNIYAFCLMLNHVHLLIQVKEPEKLVKIMRSLNLKYTLYFNAKYEKIGHLWQDRYKSKIIEKDAYLLECANYIETNPIRTSLISNIADYPWSSYTFRNKNCGLVDSVFEF